MAMSIESVSGSIVDVEVESAVEISCSGQRRENRSIVSVSTLQELCLDLVNGLNTQESFIGYGKRIPAWPIDETRRESRQAVTKDLTSSS